MSSPGERCCVSRGAHGIQQLEVKPTGHAILVKPRFLLPEYINLDRIPFLHMPGKLCGVAPVCKTGRVGSTPTLGSKIPLWRNLVRRARLRIWCPKGRVGSNPSRGTTISGACSIRLMTIQYGQRIGDGNDDTKSEAET